MFTVLTEVLTEQLRATQRNDPMISVALDLKQRGKQLSPPERKKMSKEVRKLLHEWNRLVVDDHGILRRKTAARNQLVLPGKYRQLQCTKNCMSTWATLDQRESRSWRDNDSTGEEWKVT